MHGYYLNARYKLEQVILGTKRMNFPTLHWPQTNEYIGTRWFVPTNILVDIKSTKSSMSLNDIMEDLLVCVASKIMEI